MTKQKQKEKGWIAIEIKNVYVYTFRVLLLQVCCITNYYYLFRLEICVRLASVQTVCCWAKRSVTSRTRSLNRNVVIGYVLRAGIGELGNEVEWLDEEEDIAWWWELAENFRTRLIKWISTLGQNKNILYHRLTFGIKFHSHCDFVCISSVMAKYQRNLLANTVLIPPPIS